MPVAGNFKGKIGYVDEKAVSKVQGHSGSNQSNVSDRQKHAWNALSNRIGSSDEMLSGFPEVSTKVH